MLPEVVGPVRLLRLRMSGGDCQQLYCLCACLPKKKKILESQYRTDLMMLCNIPLEVRTHAVVCGHYPQAFSSKQSPLKEFPYHSVFALHNRVQQQCVRVCVHFFVCVLTCHRIGKSCTKALTYAQLSPSLWGFYSSAAFIQGWLK